MSAHTPRTLFLAPVGSGVGLTIITLGLVRALDARGVRVAFFKPIAQPAQKGGPDRSAHFIRATTQLKPADPISQTEASRLISSGDEEQLMEHVIANFHTSCADADVVVVEGLVHTDTLPNAAAINSALVRALSAHVILVGKLASGSDDDYADFESTLEITIREFGGVKGENLLGCIVNRIPEPLGTPPTELAKTLRARCPFLSRTGFPIIGAVTENAELSSPRTIDIARHLNARIINEGELDTRRVRNFTLLARTVPNMLVSLKPGYILVTPADRADVVVAVAMAAVNKIAFAGLVLTGDTDLPPRILELCRPALESGLPILKVHTNSWQTATHLSNLPREVPIDDIERARASMEHVANHIDAVWLAEKCAAQVEARMSPAAFTYRLVELARQANKRIVLPEGSEPRTIRAAALCAQRGIARSILLGNRDEILRVANGLEITLPDGVEIIDPAEVRERYIDPLFEMRRHKGISRHDAADFLEDNVWLGTTMLAMGQVDGLVSGALHTSANTIRPALQIIKTKPGARVVSSIFYMCLPDQVLVYGDCAVNPDPDAEMLADIAIQSAESAISMGIPARVAMISYSTGESGSGADVDKVREATRIAKAKRPDILLDGPLQYDAAAIADVAAQKAPDSPLAGRATVFIFPDLNTGNTTYKAVQRSAHVISVGPVLQGLKRPVNDLSRGALVEDIVYTIAITAIQAKEA
ncbi:MAG: phosphate acetyltransferase [Verrucomicrobia bacterium]|nr:phosphate acetyltransferase [Verrucomicrobiota bacterium]